MRTSSDVQQLQISNNKCKLETKLAVQICTLNNFWIAFEIFNLFIFSRKLKLVSNFKNKHFFVEKC